MPNKFNGSNMDPVKTETMVPTSTDLDRPGQRSDDIIKAPKDPAEDKPIWC